MYSIYFKVALFLLHFFWPKRVCAPHFLGQRRVFCFFVFFCALEWRGKCFCGGNGSECQLFDIWTFKLSLEERELELSELWARETSARMQRKWISSVAVRTQKLGRTNLVGPPSYHFFLGVTNWWRLEPVNVVYFWFWHFVFCFAVCLLHTGSSRGTAKSEIILFMSVQFDIHALALTLLYAFSCIYWPARYS